MNIIKKSVQKILGSLGYEIQKKGFSNNFEVLAKLINKTENINIFDVGANEGRWIDSVNEFFKKPNIHAFEPSEKEFQILKKKYSEETNIVLNNFALGEMEDEQYFNINYKGGLNSFYDVNQNTNWFRIWSEKRFKE